MLRADLGFATPVYPTGPRLPQGAGGEFVFPYTDSCSRLGGLHTIPHHVERNWLLVGWSQP